MTEPTADITELTSDRRFNLLIVIVILVAVITAVGAMASLNASDNTGASRRTDEIAACRAEYRAGIDDATTSVFEAYGNVQDANARLNIAAASYDGEAIARESETILAAIDRRQAAIESLLEAGDIYAAAAQLSGEDPDLFLSQCKEK